jgi:hypothetical protein
MVSKAFGLQNHAAVVLTKAFRLRDLSGHHRSVQLPASNAIDETLTFFPRASQGSGCLVRRKIFWRANHPANPRARIPRRIGLAPYLLKSRNSTCIASVQRLTRLVMMTVAARTPLSQQNRNEV